MRETLNCSSALEGLSRAAISATVALLPAVRPASRVPSPLTSVRSMASAEETRLEQEVKVRPRHVLQRSKKCMPRAPNPPRQPRLNFGQELVARLAKRGRSEDLYPVYGLHLGRRYMQLSLFAKAAEFLAVCLNVVLRRQQLTSHSAEVRRAGRPLRQRALC